MSKQPEDKPQCPIVIYQSADGSIATEVRLEGETVWLSQEQLSQLFGRERSVISKHLRNVFAEGELEADSVCAKFAHTAGVSAGLVCRLLARFDIERVRADGLLFTNCICTQNMYTNKT